MTFLMAGHETTAVSLSWTWYLLSKHPDVAKRLGGELAQVLAGRTPKFDDLPNLRYARMVVEESMRLYPPVWGAMRTVVKDSEIGGYYVPAKSTIVLTQWVTHRHPAFWDNPEGFDPERFTPENVAKRPKHAYFPFLAGPHQCIGNDFALMEATLVLAMIAQNFRLDLLPGRPVEPKPLLTLRPAGGIWVTAREPAP
jgi:cytochrome P450